MTKKRKELDKDIDALKAEWNQLDGSQRAERWAINAQIHEAIVKSGLHDWPWLDWKYRASGKVPPKK
jgi:hypothetical protein